MKVQKVARGQRMFFVAHAILTAAGEARSRLVRVDKGGGACGGRAILY